MHIYTALVLTVFFVVTQGLRVHKNVMLHFSGGLLHFFLKQVAEEMLNPFGDDDDDFDVNSVIDFNLEVMNYTAMLMFCMQCTCTHTRYMQVFVPTVNIDLPQCSVIKLCTFLSKFSPGGSK